MKYFERFLWLTLVAALLVVGYEFVRIDSVLTEFSPDTLELRSRNVGGYLSWPRVRKSPLASYLVEQGYVRPLETKHPRWLVVGHYSAEWRDGQGHLAYVFTWNQDRWIAWCEEDPDRARLLWSTVFPLLRSNDNREVRAGETIARSSANAESIDDLKWKIDSVLIELGFPSQHGTIE
jgi:hypothetical protein